MTFENSFAFAADLGLAACNAHDLKQEGHVMQLEAARYQ